MKRYSWPLLLLLFFAACNDHVKIKEVLPATKKSNAPVEIDEPTNTETDKINSNNPGEEATTNSDADILNNISLHESGGLKVAQAFLTFEDGKLVPKSNKTSLRTPVYLNLMIEKGWEIREGQSSIDATEIITTHDGEIVLNAPNLFKTKPVMDATDATRILLKANITKTRSDIEYFIVNYRVWDKWNDAEVKGSYKLYVSDESNADR
jgi:hypothetical protein